jgi:DNA-binding GntR family transcriptional regulator
MEPTVALTANRGLVSRRPTLTDDTYDAIMGLLMSQQIKPGQRINIDALSRVLGVSVTPVRESLARLESEALVTKRPLVGYAATPLLSLDQLDDMYDVRLALEPLAARQAALRADGEQLEELAAAVGPRRDTIAPRSDEHLLVALDDARLHSAIASATGNDFLRDAVQRLHSHLHLYRLYQSAQIAQKATLREHDLIIRALRRRDSEAAEQAMRKHLEASRARLVEIVERARGLPR